MRPAERQQTMNATVAWGYQLLDRDEQRAFNKSLLVRADTSVVTTRPLFYMLETVRAYAARELAASGVLPFPI